MAAVGGQLKRLVRIFNKFKSARRNMSKEIEDMINKYTANEHEKEQALCRDLNEIIERLDRIEKHLGLEPLFVQDHLGGS